MEKTLRKYFPLFVLPTLAAFTIGFIVPFAEGIYLSFCKFTTINNAQWVGLSNYSRALSDATFLQAFWFTVAFTVVSTLSINLLAFAVALVLTRGIKGTNLFRTVFFMPNLIGGIVLGYIWQILINCVLSIVEEPLLGLNTPAGYWGLIILMACTPIGLIDLPLIKATILHVPVIIGSILLGPKKGAFLGAMFGLSSMIKNTLVPALDEHIENLESGIAQAGILRIVIHLPYDCLKIALKQTVSKRYQQQCKTSQRQQPRSIRIRSSNRDGQKYISQCHCQQAFLYGSLVVLCPVGDESSRQTQYIYSAVEKGIYYSCTIVTQTELRAKKQRQYGIHNIVAKSLSHITEGCRYQPFRMSFKHFSLLF